MGGPRRQTKHYSVSKILSERVKFMVAGEALPTVAELMVEFDASQATITSALSRLRSQGLIERPLGRKRLVVSEIGEKTLFKIAFIRPLWASPDYDGVFNAIYEAGLEQHWGFSVHTFADAASLNLERAMGDADAAIVLGVDNPPDHLIRAFNSCRKPLVFLRDKPEQVRSNLVWIDDREVGRLATRHLLGLGHRRILVFLSEPPNPSSTYRMIGWREEMLAAKQRRYEELLLDCSVRRGKNAITGSYERLKQWLAGPHPEFTAVFCVSWTGALAAMRALREIGLQIPRDVSVITYGSEAAFSEFLNPPLTTIQTDVAAHASETIRLIKDALTNGSAEPKSIFLKPEIAVGESTSKPARG